MSFLTRQHAILIGAGTVFLTDPTLVDEECTINEEGWDGLEQTYALRKASLSAEECAGFFPVGVRLGLRTFWIVGARPERVAPGFWLIKVTCKGWGIEKPAKVRIGASAESQNASNVTTPDGTFDSVQTHENTPTVSVSYLAEDLDTVSNTELVGRAASLPIGVTVTVADTVWATLNPFVYHWPNGWVLMGSEQDRIPGTDVGLVTDNYSYVRDATPGGG